MTPPHSFFLRPEGGGWLVLCGGPADDATLARAAALIQQAGTLVVLVPTASDREAVEARLVECSIVCGVPGEILTLGGKVPMDERLSEASMVVLPDMAEAREIVEALEETGSGEVLLATMDAGAVIVAEGRSAEALGEAVEADPPAAGSGWLRQAVIQSRFVEGTPCRVLGKRPTLFRLGLGEHAALALGPEGEVEVWGEPAPTVTLGAAWIR
jgi:hypothetical protein